MAAAAAAAAAVVCRDGGSSGVGGVYRVAAAVAVWCVSRSLCMHVCRCLCLHGTVHY